MSSSKNLDFEKTSFLNKSNSAFIEEMYLKFVNKDADLPESWANYFEGIGEELNVIAKEINGPSWGPTKKKIDIDELQKKIEEQDKNDFNNVKLDTSEKFNFQLLADSNKDSISAVALIRAYRLRGHLLADLDPLEMRESEYLDELHPDFYGFKKENYDKKIFLNGVINRKYANIREILKFMKKTYCGKIGYEFMHISNPDERKWFRDRIEQDKNALQFTKNGKEAILNKLVQAEGFEKFLATKYVGTKRFGLDGGESLIPALEQIIKIGGQNNIKEVKIGMSHRGRLNVLANVLQKSYKKIFNEFAGEFSTDSEDSAGDVKYHLGASSDREFDGNSVHVSLTDNPSHLEAVNPVVLGQTRAKQFFHKDRERNKVIPILIHGDAAFAGQGVVAECFAMSGLPGHNTGGTIHIIVNNQIGFTTSPRFARSSPYPSDVAKMVEAPILHVNGDDPEAVVYATRIATEFRLKFNRDVVVDLICYRRFGHNEGDEPSFTQPLMYKKIRSHPSVYKIYGNKLVNEKSITEELLNQNVKSFKDLLDEQYAKVNGEFLVKKPKSLTSKQAMILGTAGFTALQCAFTTKQTREVLLLGEKVQDVLVTGASGGVGSIATMILSKLGCNVTAVTGKDSNSEYLKSIGAKNVINTSELDKEARPLDKGIYDGAVDTVGGNVLSNVLSHVKDAGIVAACGNASGIKLNTTVMPFIIRGVKLWGINSVTASIKRREFLWGEVEKLVDFALLEKSIKEVSLGELIDVYPKMLQGKTSGRYIVNLNK